MKKLILITLIVLLKSSAVVASEDNIRSFRIPLLPHLTDTSILATVGRAFDMVSEKYNEGIEWLSPLAFKYALKLDLPVEELANQQLLSFIDDWYGVKYRFGGDSKSGIDHLLQDEYRSSQRAHACWFLPRQRKFRACRHQPRGRLRQHRERLLQKSLQNGGSSACSSLLAAVRQTMSIHRKGAKDIQRFEEYTMDMTSVMSGQHAVV
ncbi:MAG: hypothetical protein LW694_13375 [Chitinophagaceae bacterium]|nr:hypothetical protein [Chitinophagaceae bacterium]